MLEALFTLSGSDIWQRLVGGHGFLITFIGLTAVFSGLCILWAVTSAFPRFISFLERKQNGSKSAAAAPRKTEPEEAPALAAAIGVALCCELEDEEVSVLTLRHIEQEMSPWVVAAKSTTMRHF